VRQRGSKKIKKEYEKGRELKEESEGGRQKWKFVGQNKSGEKGDAR